MKECPVDALREAAWRPAGQAQTPDVRAKTLGVEAAAAQPLTVEGLTGTP